MRVRSTSAMSGAREEERRVRSASVRRWIASPAFTAPQVCACRIMRSRRLKLTRARPNALRGPFGVGGGGVERAEVAGRGDAEADGCRALRLEPAEEGADLGRAAFGDDVDHLVEVGLGRGGRHGGHVGGRDRRGVAVLVEGELLDRLAEVAGVERAGQRSISAMASRVISPAPACLRTDSISARDGGSS
jgi:hypothetical protein